MEANHHARQKYTKVGSKKTSAVCKAGKANLPPVFILLPSHFKDSFGKMHRPDTCPTPLMSHKSRTPLVHHLILFLFHRFEAWSHRPPSQAPGLGSFLADAIPSHVDFRQSLVDFQCFGKGLWTKTMANHVKHGNLQGDLRH